VARHPVDFRKGIDGLALAVQEMFGLDRVLRGGLRVPGEAGGRHQAAGLGTDRDGARSQAAPGRLARLAAGAGMSHAYGRGAAGSSVFAGRNRVSVIHSKAWMPTPSAVRMLI